MEVTTTSHIPPSGLEVTPRIATKNRNTRFYRYSGICSDVRFGAHSNTLKNLQRAVAERVLKVPDGKGGLKDCPKPRSEGYYNSMMLPFRMCLENRIRNDSSFPIPPLSDEAFVSLYSGAKKKRYQDACDSLLRESVIPRDARVSCFVKVEKINFSSKCDPCPRVIQPRSFRYSAALGKHIKHLEKPLFKCIDDIFGGPTVLKGYDCIASATHLRNMWNEFDHPIAVGMDASRFDQHCSVPALKWEHEVWAMLATSTREVRRLLALQLETIGRGYVDDGMVKYRTDGCRMSGDMNTSSGNCLLMCAMVYSYCHSHNVRKFRLANNGDDCVLIIEKFDHGKLLDIPEWFTQVGYTMKVEKPVDVFEQISFCQTQPVFDGIGYRMVRDPRVSMAKDLTSTLDLSNDRTRALWLNAMHHGGTALTTGIPVFQAFYSMFPTTNITMTTKETTLADFNQSGFSRMQPKIVSGVRAVTPEARYSFWLAFGLLPDLQVVLENRFSSMSLGHCEMVPHQQDYSELSILVENNL